MRVRLSLAQKINLSYALVTLVSLATLAVIGGAALMLWASQGCRGWESAAPSLQTRFNLNPPPLAPPQRAAAWLRAFFQKGTVRGRAGEFLEVSVDFSARDIPRAALVDAEGRVVALFPAHTPGQAVGQPWESAFAAYDPPRLPQNAPQVTPRDSLCLIAVPWATPEHQSGWLVFLYRPINPWKRGLNFIVILLLLGLLIAPAELATGTVAGWLLSRALVRRLRRIASVSEAWARGDFDAAIADTGSDELAALAQRLDGMADRLRNLLHTERELASLEERQRLSRELHDAVKQQLFAAAMQLTVAKEQWAQAPPQAQAHFDEGLALLHQAQRELVHLLHQQRAPDLQAKTLAQALEAYIAGWEARTGIRVHRTFSLPAPLPPAIGHVLFRVVQESLANIERHSHADKVVLDLVQKGRAVRLSVADNGAGFAPQETPHHGQGLQNMRERVTRLGGRFDLKSAAGKGTCVEVQLPLPEGERP